MSSNLNNGNGRISSLSRLQNLLSRNRRNSFIIRNHSLNNINNINNINNSNQIPHDLSSILNLYISMYNNINRQIDFLYYDLETAHNNINYIVQLILDSSERDRSIQNSRNNIPLSSRYPPTQPSPEEFPDPQVIIDDQNPRRLFINNRPYIIENMEYFNTGTRLRNTNTQPLDYSQLLQSFFSPILVRPTQYQISNATRTIRYCDIENPLNSSCPISLENFSSEDEVSQIIHCGHIFKKDQLHHWFQSNVRCPVCRFDIRTNNRDVSQEQQQDQDQEDTYEDIPPLIPIYETQTQTQTPTQTPTQTQTQTPTERQSENIFENFYNNYNYNTGYSQEIENLIQTTTENLTNILINGYTGTNGTTDTSNNTQTRFLFDSSNNAFILETLFFNPRYTRH